jgi:hypothetical protein
MTARLVPTANVCLRSFLQTQRYTQTWRTWEAFDGGKESGEGAGPSLITAEA